MYEGFVKYYNEARGFGFITPDEGGRDVYFHVYQVAGRAELAGGQRVRYEVEMETRGPRAYNVEPIEG